MAEFGNLSKNVISGPGFWNVDASLFRTFDIKERFHLQIRANATSIMNTPQWGNPSTDITSANFGYDYECWQRPLRPDASRRLRLGRAAVRVWR